MLRQATRENDLVGRYGGDEFAVVLPRTDAEGASRVADRILESLTAARSGDGHAKLQASIGLTTLWPADGSGTESGHATAQAHALPASYFHGVAQELIRTADEALYRAKRDGGARLCAGKRTAWPEVAAEDAAPLV